MSDKSWGVSDIKVLSTAQAIRKRPTMYLGPLKPKVLTKLIIEATGLCRINETVTHIDIDVDESGNVMIYDSGGDGKLHAPPLDQLLTQLYAGGPNPEANPDKYRHSVDIYGLAVINAVCEYMRVYHKVGDKTHKYSFKCGEHISSLESVTDKDDVDGITLKFKFDPLIFGDIEIDVADLETAVEELRKTCKAEINLYVWQNEWSFECD